LYKAELEGNESYIYVNYSQWHMEGLGKVRRVTVSHLWSVLNCRTSTSCKK